MARHRFSVRIVALLPAGLRAQLPKERKLGPGKLDGTVVNAKGAPVSGLRSCGKARRTDAARCVSDAQGHFRIPAVRAGLVRSAGIVRRRVVELGTQRDGAPRREISVKLRLQSTALPVQAVLELTGKMRTWDVPQPAALPHDPAVDPQGNVWFTLQESGQLARFTPDTQEWKLFSVPTANSGPTASSLTRRDTSGSRKTTREKLAGWTPNPAWSLNTHLPRRRIPIRLCSALTARLWFTAQESN